MAMAPAITAARTLPELERALVRQPPQSTPFTEYRFSRLMKRVMVARGTLEYREPGVWVRTQDLPNPERAEISNEEIRLRRGGGAERRIALSRAPQLRLLLDSLRALLEGRVSQLGDRFEVSLTSNDAAWGLRLVPRDARQAKEVAHILVFGSGDAPECIEVAEPDGDASFTLLGLAAAEQVEPEADTGAMRTRIQTRCRGSTVEVGASG